MVTLSVEDETYFKENYNLVRKIDISRYLNISLLEIYELARKFNLIKPRSIARFTDILSEVKNKIGVYRIINTKTGREYIGSSNNIAVRLQAHIGQLDHNKHVNSELQQDWNLDSLVFQINVYTLCDSVNEAVILEAKLIRETNNKYNKSQNTDYLSIVKTRTIEEMNKKIYPNIDIKSTGCWEWKGRIKDGYGIMRFSVNGKRKEVSAHKLMWVFKNNQNMEDGFRLCHTCDNRKCINPDHLVIGTDKSNAEEREQRNRGRKSKYKEEILKLKKEGFRDCEIAKQLDISPSTVFHITKRNRLENSKANAV